MCSGKGTGCVRNLDGEHRQTGSDGCDLDRQLVQGVKVGHCIPSRVPCPFEGRLRVNSGHDLRRVVIERADLVGDNRSRCAVTSQIRPRCDWSCQSARLPVHDNARRFRCRVQVVRVLQCVPLSVAQVEHFAVKPCFIVAPQRKRSAVQKHRCSCSGLT